jgi:hypothetical protein
LVDDHIGSVEVAMDERGLVGGEQRQPLLDPVGDLREQIRVMTGQLPSSLDLLERRAHHGWVERGPRLPRERLGQPRRQQAGRNRHPVQGAQRSAEALDDCLARAPVPRRPRFVQASTAQAFRDVPRSVRAVAVGEVPGVRHLAAVEQADDCGLVAVGVAESSVVVQSYDVLVADPHAADPAGLGDEAPGGRQTSGVQRSQQCRIGSQGNNLATSTAQNDRIPG